MSSRFGSLLLRIGGLGFFWGFASWIAWVILMVLSFAGILTYDDFRFMSGIFFQAALPRLIFYGLLSLSLLFSAVGCFALSKKQTSALAIVSGVVFVATFVSAVTYWLSFIGLPSGQLYPNPYPPQLSYSTRLFPLLFFLGIILWGATLLSTVGKIGVNALSRAAGVLFIISGGFGILLWQVILYLGFEYWLLLFGSLYAVAALMSALIYFRISRMVEKPIA